MNEGANVTTKALCDECRIDMQLCGRLLVKSETCPDCIRRAKRDAERTISARMTTLQVDEIVQTGDSRRGVVVEIDRSGSTSWCVRVRMNANGLVVGYRPSDLVYVGPATVYADE